MVKKLETTSHTLEIFKEIATQRNSHLPDLWNSLTPAERVFAYYLYRASIPGNRIIADQTHRHAVEIIQLFEKLYLHKKMLAHEISDAFAQELEIFLVYLHAHHSQYFLKEFENHKRTPARLNLAALTPETLVHALTLLGESDAQAVISRLEPHIFDEHFEPTVTVEGSIEQSAGNYYSPGFTQRDFDKLPADEQVAINRYSYIAPDGTPRTQQYKIGGRYSAELEIAYFWLNKAREHALSHPDRFDEHIPASLKHMLLYVQTGDEQEFRAFSIEWLKTHSRIDFNFGFVEVYQDPKQFRGSFEADVTIKVIDMQKINALLPALEEALPFPAEFKRQNLHDRAAIPNASVNAKIFASGDSGPVKLTAAYCLPNYTDIRSQHGSKQIIYQFGKGLGELINPELSLRLFHIQEHADWLAQYDPHGMLNHDIWDVHVLLHETLGHGSGRDLYDSETTTQRIGGYSAALEELRAEIIALYTSIFNFDQLNAAGLFKDWVQKIGKEKLIEWCILHMAHAGLTRLLVQADDATEIVQAHARADTTIMNYLLDHGKLELVEEKHPVDDTEHTVIGIRLTDLPAAMQSVKELAILVQHLKSTANGQGVNELMRTYGICVRKPEYIKLLKANRQAVQGDLKEVAEIYPRLVPVYDATGAVVDIDASWPTSFLEQQLELSRLALQQL